EERPMYERKPNDADVMANYFDTMRQFLETQGQVMAAYMGEASPMPRATYARTPRLAAPIQAQAMPVAAMPAPAPAQAVAAPAPVVAAPAPAPTPAPAVEVPVAAAPASPAPAPTPA